MDANYSIETIRTALSTIGKAWTKPGTGEVRYYVNDWKSRIGMDVDYYKTGNVANVDYKYPMSNCHYKKHIQGTKVWIGEDLKVHVDYMSDGDVEADVIATLEAAVREACEAIEPTVTVVPESESITLTVIAEPAAEGQIEESVEYLDAGALPWLSAGEAEAMAETGDGIVIQGRQMLSGEPGDTARYTERCDSAEAVGGYLAQWDRVGTGLILVYRRDGTLIGRLARNTRSVVLDVGGMLAEVEIPEDGSEDLWHTIERTYPEAYDLIDEGMILPPGDYFIADRILMGHEGELIRRLQYPQGESWLGDDKIYIESDPDSDDGIRVTWTDIPGKPYADIPGGEGVARTIRQGLRYGLDGWEDGQGRLLSPETAQWDCVLDRARWLLDTGRVDGGEEFGLPLGREIYQALADEDRLLPDAIREGDCVLQSARRDGVLYTVRYLDPDRESEGDPDDAWWDGHFAGISAVTED